MGTDLTDLMATIKVEIEATAKKAVDLGIPEAVLKISKLLSTAFGSAIGEADQIFWDRRAIAKSGTPPAGDDALILAAAAPPLTNPLGGAINFANLKAIVIFNRSDETLSHVGGDHTATDAQIVVLDVGSTFLGPCKTLANGQVIEPGGMYIATTPLAAGWTVATDDILQVDNEDADDEALFDILLIGDST